MRNAAFAERGEAERSPTPLSTSRAPPARRSRMRRSPQSHPAVSVECASCEWTCGFFRKTAALKAPWKHGNCRLFPTKAELFRPLRCGGNPCRDGNLLPTSLTLSFRNRIPIRRLCLRKSRCLKHVLRPHRPRLFPQVLTPRPFRRRFHHRFRHRRKIFRKSDPSSLSEIVI